MRNLREEVCAEFRRRLFAVADCVFCRGVPCQQGADHYKDHDPDGDRVYQDPRSAYRLFYEPGLFHHRDPDPSEKFIGCDLQIMDKRLHFFERSFRGTRCILDHKEIGVYVILRRDRSAYSAQTALFSRRSSDVALGHDGFEILSDLSRILQSVIDVRRDCVIDIRVFIDVAGGNGSRSSIGGFLPDRKQHIGKKDCRNSQQKDSDPLLHNIAQYAEQIQPVFLPGNAAGCAIVILHLTLLLLP